MTRSLKIRFCCLILAVALLFLGGAVLSYHGELWFPILERFRVYDDLDLTPANEVEATPYTLAELRQMRGVVYTDTMMLINYQYALPENYEVNLIEYNGAKIHPEIKDAYIAMRDYVKEMTGIRIYVSSDYRTAEEQADIYESYPEGIAAEPRYSEHQTGLALDVYAPHFVGEKFLRSEAGRLVNRICKDYGFILRYPVGKEEITGISYEPWHLRYVGTPHAELIMDSGLSYEEYIAYLQPNVWYRTSGGVLSARLDEASLQLPNNWKSCEISPDNTGYYLVTVTLTPP